MQNIITIFRSRLRPEHAEEYHRLAPQVQQIAESMRGFIAIKSYSAPDGERISIVEFDSEVNHKAWRDHPLHREAQRLGREKFYSEYSIQICRLEKANRMRSENAQPA